MNTSLNDSAISFHELGMFNTLDIHEMLHPYRILSQSFGREQKTLRAVLC